jgi:hypothetical protein
MSDASCDVDCEMSEWKNDGDCSKDCGGGSQKQTRTINTPKKYLGKDCWELL